MPGLRGPGIHESTAQTLVDGWYHTGRDGEKILPASRLARPIGEDFLELQVIGGNTNIRFDSDRGGDSFVTLATLQSITTATLADIIYPQPDLVI